MSPLNIDSFVIPGYPGNEVESQVLEPSAVGGPDRPVTPEYRIQPVVWMFVTLALAIVGLYYFLEE